MNVFKKSLALFLLASLTAGQAQAVTIELTTDKVVGAIAQLLEKGGNKVLQLLEKGNFSRVILGLSMSGICGIASYELYNEIVSEKNNLKNDIFLELSLRILSIEAAILAAGCSVKTIELIYNA